jgi:ribonuclease BN (tRNA processing enzyme)
MSGRITLLGTGTCQLQSHRVASAILAELGALRIVFDFGRGIGQRLADSGLCQDDVEHVVLSHFHPDHFSDLLPYLHAACWSRIDPRSADLHIYGPRGLEVQMMRLLGLVGPDELTRDHFQVHVHEIRQRHFTIGDQSFSFCPLPPANNHGLRFGFDGTTYAFTGDSYYHKQEVEFLRGVDLAVIDAGHLSETEILALAVTTQAPRIVCSHLYQELDQAALNTIARERGYEGELLVGQDLMIFGI